MTTIRAVDLFCGAGGTSTGLAKACEKLGYKLELVAINHWDTAIATHKKNHPNFRHICETLDSVDPRKEIPEGYLDILVASPECTHHSNARGGKPMSDQSRATAWHVLRWAEALYIEHIIIENIREFRGWGPLDANGRPIKSKRGALYRQFLASLRALGYTVSDRLLNAADYGDATTRHRLFIQAKRSRGAIRWPEATHLPPGSLDVLGDAKAYRPAREIIDWSLEGTSIFNRKRPLSENTMRRIMVGLQKYSGLPFVMNVSHPHGNGKYVRSIEDPLPTLTTAQEHAFVEPFIVVLRNHSDALSIDEPIPTIAAKGTHIGLAEPFLVEYHGSHDGRDDGDRRVSSLDLPLKTVDASNRMGLVQAYLVNMKGQSIGRAIDDPVSTITSGGGRLYLAEPFLVKYNGNGENVESIDEPLDTITSRDRFGLVMPVVVCDDKAIGYLDIRFRMLQAHELAMAMSFPGDYHFTGTKTEQVKQIGNAVPVGLAAALCEAALSGKVAPQRAAIAA